LVLLDLLITVGIHYRLSRQKPDVFGNKDCNNVASCRFYTVRAGFILASEAAVRDHEPKNHEYTTQDIPTWKRQDTMWIETEEDKDDLQHNGGKWLHRHKL